MVRKIVGVFLSNNSRKKKKLCLLTSGRGRNVMDEWKVLQGFQGRSRARGSPCGERKGQAWLGSLNLGARAGSSYDFLPTVPSLL